MSLLEKILEQEEAGFNLYEIKLALRKQGFSDQEIENAFGNYRQNKTKNFNAKYPLLAHKLTPVILLILFCILYFFIIPNKTAFLFGMPLGILGGLIILALTIWTLFKIWPNFSEKNIAKVVIIGIVTLTIFMTTFYLKISNFSDNELDKKGVITNAIITSRSQWRIKSSRKSTIVVLFQTKENVTEEASIEVSENEYNVLTEGKEIRIKYSSENPEIATLVDQIEQ